MSAYVAIYKCRMCGEIIEAHRTSEAKAIQYMHAAVSGNVFNFMDPHMVEPHYCDNGDIGIADFHGFRKAGD